MKPRPCISIDLGSSYTKLAIRGPWDRNEDFVQAEYVTDPANWNFDQGLSLCIPTLAAFNADSDRWLFGADVYDLQVNATGWKCYQNWKRNLFGDYQPFDATSGPLRVPNASLFSTEIMDAILSGFFTYLLKIATDRIEVDDCRVRVAIPEFGLRTPGETELHQAMLAAGWPGNNRISFEAEPAINAIGVLTNGQNAVLRGGTEEEPCPDFAAMLVECPLQQGVLEFVCSGNSYIHWTLVADLGAYTLDFAVLGFDTANLQHDLDGRVEGKRRLAISSEPTGISHLIERIHDLLASDAQEYFELILSEPGDSIALFFARILTGGHFEDPITFVSIGEGAEGESIRQIIADFAGEIASKFTSFLSQGNFDRLEEVILTGGGMNLSPVRNAILRAMEPFNVKHAFTPQHEQDPESTRIHQTMDPLTVRGATAIGGSSIHFDFLEVPEYE